MRRGFLHGWSSGAALLAASAFAFGCQTTPDEPPEGDCTWREGEASLHFECGPSDDDWQQRAEEEAKERFERTEPSGRP